MNHSVLKIVCILLIDFGTQGFSHGFNIYINSNLIIIERGQIFSFDIKTTDIYIYHTPPTKEGYELVNISVTAPNHADVICGETSIYESVKYGGQRVFTPILVRSAHNDEDFLPIYMWKKSNS